jgi:putative dehydrogenase
MLRARVPAMFSKAYRWVAEMEQIGEFLGDAANGTEIFAGAARLYEAVAAEWEKGPKASPSLAAIGSFLGK